MGSLSSSGIIGSETVAQIRSEAMSVREVVEVSERLRAISDPNRLRLLDFLLGEKKVMLCVSDLAALSGTDISSASHHLRKAKKAGLVKSFRFDKHALYELTPEGKELISAARSLATTNQP